MRSSIIRLALLCSCLMVAAVAALPSTAGAASGYSMSRDFSANGDQARAYGKLCTGSKYGKWRWRVSVGSGDLRASYRWIEPIYPDGKARHLRFTFIGGPVVESQPESLQPLFVASVKRALNKITVQTTARGTKLKYVTPTGGKSVIPFKPTHRC
jgi:hypothetical protein